MLITGFQELMNRSLVTSPTGLRSFSDFGPCLDLYRKGGDTHPSDVLFSPVVRKYRL